MKRAIDDANEGRVYTNGEVKEKLNKLLKDQKHCSDWDKLSDVQKQGILDAIDEIEEGKGIPNEVVFDKIRKKYSNK